MEDPKITKQRWYRHMHHFSNCAGWDVKFGRGIVTCEIKGRHQHCDRLCTKTQKIAPVKRRRNAPASIR